MRLSISNIAWEANQDKALYQEMRRSGYSGLEIAPTRLFSEHPYSRQKEASFWAGDLYAGYGITVSSMQSVWYGRKERLFGTEEERNILLSYTMEAIDFAQAIACRNLVFGSPVNRNLKAGEDAEAAIPFFRKLGDYAASHGTVLSLEANPSVYRTNFMNTTKEAIEIARKVDSEGIRVNLDLGTVICNGEKLQELGKDWKWIHHIHISEPYLKPVQPGKIHKELAELLAACNGYGGYLSIEMGKGLSVEEIAAVMKKVRDIYYEI